MRHRMSPLVSGIVVLGSAALFSTPLCAQTRDERIQQAREQYDNFEADAARANLLAALDPTDGPTDSLWALGVHLLAQIYVDDGKPDLARIWLQWGMRLNPSQRVDPVLYVPEVIEASDSARQHVLRTANPGDSVVDTRWEWPRGRVAEGSGRISIAAADLGAPVSVLVRGRVLEEGDLVEFEPGSYEFQATAPGHLAVRVTREVLPGITTVLKFNLRRTVVAAAPPPAAPDTLLPAGIGTSAAQELVKLQVRRFGPAAECRVGFVVGATYVVTTYDAIKGADSVEAQFADGSRMTRGIRVAAYDATSNVAVLKLPGARPDSLAIASNVRADQAAWSLTYGDCLSTTAVTMTRTPIAQTGPPLRTSMTAPGAPLGGALIDRAGAALGVLGVAQTPQTAVDGSALRTALAEARRNEGVKILALGEVAREQNLAPAPPTPTAPPPTQPQIAEHHGKKFPWPIAAIGGAALAGGAIALLAGGGGGDGNNNNNNNTPTTGSITISVPNQ